MERARLMLNAMPQAMPVAVLQERDGFMPRPDPTRPDLNPSYSRPLTQTERFRFSETTHFTLNAEVARERAHTSAREAAA